MKLLILNNRIKAKYPLGTSLKAEKGNQIPYHSIIQQTPLTNAFDFALILLWILYSKKNGRYWLEKGERGESILGIWCWCEGWEVKGNLIKRVITEVKTNSPFMLETQKKKNKSASSLTCTSSGKKLVFFFFLSLLLLIWRIIFSVCFTSPPGRRLPFGWRKTCS